MRCATKMLVVLASSLLLGAATCQATLFNGSYTVTANSNPATGLAIGTLNDFGSPVTGTTNSFTGLNVGAAPHFVDLFEIFALESPITAADTAPRPISVGFTFTSPAAAGGTISGVTFGSVNLQEGLLTWNGSLHLLVGNQFLNITLSDAEFGSDFNGVVTATLSVPEPATLLLLGAGLAGLAAIGRKRPATPQRT